MKKITFCICILIGFSAFSQKTLDSIRTFSLEQSDPAGNFKRQYFIKTSDSSIEYVDDYIADLKFYNKRNLFVGKYDNTCKSKFSTFTSSEYNQFSQAYDNVYIFYNKYDQNCNLNQFTYYDSKKMDTFLVAYYDQYDDKGNFGSEIDYYDFDGNGLKKYADNKIFYKYNSQNKIIESSIKENKNGTYITTSKRILEYDSEGRFVKSQFFDIDTSGNERLSFEGTMSYFNGGTVESIYFLDFTTNKLYQSSVDSAFVDKDNDPTFRHRIARYVTGEIFENNAYYYYYAGSSATTATYIDPDIAINNFISVHGAMFFTVDNPKGKNMDIQVSDINGRLIFKNTSNESTWHSPQINVNEGMYVLKVETKDGVKVQKKIAH
jgi:Secretion system C-terminal sorting domain